MFVCFCKAVTERTVKAAIADGAKSIEDISMRCSAGMRCRGCWPALADLLADAGHHVDIDVEADRRARLVGVA